MPTQTTAEPSMDEILASIRRIISEDAPAAPAEPAVEGAEEGPEDVSESEPTPMASDAGPAPEATTEPGPAALATPEPEPPPPPVAQIAASAEPAPSNQPAALETHMPSDFEHASTAAESSDHGLVSPDTAGATASAFESLATTAEQAARAESSVALPAPGRSLEDLTADLLRPLLKAWLDEHLPQIVRARVDEEVTRIARNRVR